MTKTVSEQEATVMIPSRRDVINGSLHVPEEAKGIVVFAHGSGSSRFSPRNRHVAKEINAAGMATLLIDLLTKKEDEVDKLTAEYRFDISLLSQRLVDATVWVKKNPSTQNLYVGYFGSSTGAAAALIAAAKAPDVVKAVVSRGGRPDLAKDYLVDVKSPTLLIVGGNDEPVIGMNQDALKKIPAVAKLAIGWFSKYLGA